MCSTSSTYLPSNSSKRYSTIIGPNCYGPRFRWSFAPARDGIFFWKSGRARPFPLTAADSCTRPMEAVINWPNEPFNRPDNPTFPHRSFKACSLAWRRSPMMNRSFLFLLPLILPAAAAPSAARAAEPDPELAKKVLAVLDKTCSRCHGKDGSKEGGVDYILDVEETHRQAEGRPRRRRQVCASTCASPTATCPAMANSRGRPRRNRPA